MWGGNAAPATCTYSDFVGKGTDQRDGVPDVQSTAHPYLLVCLRLQGGK